MKYKKYILEDLTMTFITFVNRKIQNSKETINNVINKKNIFKNFLTIVKQLMINLIFFKILIII
jgi:hypothetical protein